MKTMRGFLVVILSACAVLALLAMLQPARAAGTIHAAAALDVVINEVAWGGTAANAADEWIELYNRGASTVDLTGWELGGGISYRFTPGQTLAPGAYLVVAEDVAALQAVYTNITIGRGWSVRSSKACDR